MEMRLWFEVVDVEQLSDATNLFSTSWLALGGKVRINFGQSRFRQRFFLYDRNVDCGLVQSRLLSF
jgi:hypothetical protein